MFNELLHSDNLWIFGMIINIVGSVTVNFGTNLMKSAHNIAEKAENEETANNNRGINERNRKSDAELQAASDETNFIWKVGMFAFVFGSIVNFISFAFAAQSLLACLGTVQFISNVFFAKFVLKETLTPRIICATVVIIVGLTLAILCSNHATMTYSTADLRRLYTTKYAVFMFGVVIFLCVLQGIYLLYISRIEKGNLLPGHKLVVPCCYALVSAIVGTQSVLQSKCLAELLKATVEGNNQFTHWFLYVILLAFICGLSFWLYRMNQALKQFEGLIIIPLLQVFWTTSAILQGGVYFQEFEKLSSLQTFGFSFGVMVVFVGVYLLAPVDRDMQVLEECFDMDVSRASVSRSIHPIGPGSTSVTVTKSRRVSSASGKDELVNRVELGNVTSSLANSVHNAGSQITGFAKRIVRKQGDQPYELQMDISGNPLHADDISITNTMMDVSNRSTSTGLSDNSNSSNFLGAAPSSSRQPKSNLKKLTAKMEL